MSSEAPINRKPLIFFERFFDSIAEKILGEQDDIDLVKLHAMAAPAGQLGGVLAGLRLLRSAPAPSWSSPGSAMPR